MKFDEIFDETTWKPIPQCPGRFVRTGTSRSIEEIIGRECVVTEHRSQRARDKVLVVLFDDGSGLISYARDDGTFLHTLNTPAGMKRKLDDLGIRL